MQYDHPSYTVIRNAHILSAAGTTMAAANAALVPSTLKVVGKALVYGVHIVNRAAGSGGTYSALKVARVDAGGTVSVRDTLSTTTLAAAAQTTVIFTTPITIDGVAQYVCVHGSASAATDVAHLGTVIWQYRMLPSVADTDITKDG